MLQALVSLKIDRFNKIQLRDELEQFEIHYVNDVNIFVVVFVYHL